MKRNVPVEPKVTRMAILATARPFERKVRFLARMEHARMNGKPLQPQGPPVKKKCPVLFLGKKRPMRVWTLKLVEETY